MHIKKKFLTKRVTSVKHCSGVFREMVESLSLEVFGRCVDVALRDKLDLAVLG